MNTSGLQDGSNKPALPANDPAEASTVPPQDGAAVSTSGNAKGSTPAPQKAPDPGATGPDLGATSPELPPMSAPADGPAQGGPAADAIPGYEILGTLGRGGMGVVYKARHLRLKRLVAVKMILAGGHAGPDDLARFRTEAEAIARLQHPSIVQVFEVGEHGALPFLSLEFCGGGSLAKKLAGTPLPPAEAAAVVETLARAMQVAHDKGVIHRDLKPANVLLAEDGTPKITDFGLAKKLDEAGQTMPGVVMGTPSYMAPEQAEGQKDIGPLADVYALGAILYECLTGRPPFRAASRMDTILQVVSAEPVSPRELNAKVPRDLETICLKCLEKQPARRYASAAALAEDLHRFLANEPILARPATAWDRLTKWRRRNPWVAALSLLVAAALLAYAVTTSVLSGILYHQIGLKEQARQDAVSNEKVAKENEKIALERQSKAIDNVLAFGREWIAWDLKRQGEQEGALALRGARADVLHVARKQLRKMADDMQLTPFNRVAIHQHTGDFARDLGLLGQAKEEYQDGYKLTRQIAEEMPDSDKARANVAVMQLRLGNVTWQLDGDVGKARQHFEDARALRQDIAEHPRSGEYTDLQNRVAFAYIAMDWGRLEFSQGRLAAARDHLAEAMEGRRAWVKEAPAKELPFAESYLSEACLWMGITLAHQGDQEGADKHLQEALDLCVRLAARKPDNVVNPADLRTFQADLAEVHGARGDVQALRGDSEAAYASYLEARKHAIAAKLHDYKAEETVGWVLLARTIERLGAAADKRGDAKDARGRREMSLKLREALIRIEPAYVSWKAAWLLALAHMDRQADDEATELAKRAAGNCELLLQLARYHAVRAGKAAAPGQRREAAERGLDLLGKAVKAGYADRLTLAGDPDLEPLRQEAGYQALLARLPR
jgi:serine/threonine-protein kinase